MDIDLQLPDFAQYRAQHSTDSFAVIAGTSAIALSYNVVHSLMIQQTSAVTTTVIGQAKIVGLLILSVLILGAILQPQCTRRSTVPDFKRLLGVWRPCAEHRRLSQPFR